MMQSSHLPTSFSALVLLCFGLACISSFITSPLTSCSAFISVDPASSMFLNTDSNSIEIYHGVNVVYKEPPFLPCYNCSFDAQYSLNQQDLLQLREWGFNMIRLGVMWSAVEPVQGEYNTTFLAEARALVDVLGEAGFVVLIDMHQDLFSPATCGEGFPQWVSALSITSRSCNESFLAKAAHLIGACKSITEFGMRFDENNDPLPADCVKHPFSLFYPTPEVATSFQSLFVNTAGIQDAFVNFWKIVAQTFASSQAVIGYDLLNEPFVGDLWSDLLDVVVPGMSDRQYLQPMYQRVTSTIRRDAGDLEHLIFYEPTPLPDALPLFGGIVSPVGFNQSIAPQQDVLSYHIYCCLSSPNACDLDGNPTDGKTCDSFNPRVMQQRVKDFQRMKSGGFLTEFGACTTGEACVDEITRTTNVADEFLQSWAYWQYKYFDDITTTSGAKEGFFLSNSTSPSTGFYTDKVASLARTYAQITQGTPTSMSFNSSTALFQMSYTTNAIAKQETTIFVSEQFYYPEGVNVQAGPTQYVSYSYKNSFVTIHHASNIPVGTVVTVNISPMF